MRTILVQIRGCLHTAGLASPVTFRLCIRGSSGVHHSYNNGHVGVVSEAIGHAILYYIIGHAKQQLSCSRLCL